MIAVNRTHRGGYITDIPQPHVRYFTKYKRRKREVEIRVSVWYGAGGNHHYIDIREEDDPIWNTKEESWHYAWDDNLGKGFSDSKKFSEYEKKKMQRWVTNTLKRFKKHKIIWRKPKFKWMYKEGD